MSKILKASLLECNEAQDAQNFKIDREIEIENTKVEGDRIEHNISENEIEKGEYRNEILHEENKKHTIYIYMANLKHLLKMTHIVASSSGSLMLGNIRSQCKNGQNMESPGVRPVYDRILKKSR